MSILNNSHVIPFTGGGYAISQSIRFDAARSCYMHRIPSVAGNRKTWTWGGWVKRGNLGVIQSIFAAGTTTDFFRIWFDGGGHINVYDVTSSAAVWQHATKASYRDSAAFYHICVAYDTGQTTAADRVTISVNGEQITAADLVKYGASDPTLNYDGYTNNTIAHNVGMTSGSASPLDAYLAEVHFVDGAALTAASFGKFDANGIWVPIAYAGTYGTNGFYITGANSAALGTDYSGNSNTYTTSGLTTADQMLDSPTDDALNGVGNYAVLNAVQEVWNAAVTLSDGNLHVTGSAASPWNNISATLSIISGKYIFATKPSTSGDGQSNIFLCNETGRKTRPANLATNSNCWTSAFGTTSNMYTTNGAQTNHTMSPVYGSNDLNLCAFNADSKNVWFGRYDDSTLITEWSDGAGGWTGNPATGINPTYAVTGTEWWFGVSTYTGRSGDADFGQNGLLSNVTIPTGYEFLNTANLPAPTIADPSAYFQAKTFTGTGASNAVALGGNSTMQSDLVWIKDRDTIVEHVLVDAVRGATKELNSDATNVETTVAQGLTSFDVDGFTLGTDANYNAAASANVAWNWKANGAGSPNTDGSITATVSADTTAGFSIGTYTGTGSNATVGHGLMLAPELLIVKERTNDVGQWFVNHPDLTANTYFLTLDAVTQQQTDATLWNSTSPTVSVFSIGTHDDINGSTDTYVFYAWHSVEGYSKIGSYTGNSNTDGPFVHCGFRPAFVMIKRTDVASEWNIIDATRDLQNEATLHLEPDTPIAETALAGGGLDFTSNGFKLRTTNGNVNTGTLIYAAFAEHPVGGVGVSQARAR